ncbi:MAG: geranylgeranyl reductase family protein [Thermoleophilia bacterium]|nr:geranylgeranyl reductase family protein [Thermoleophilia bacterium]
MRAFDAIVVGAGPAGSLAAYHLAAAGASVVLLDRERFPRDKPCGGGVTGRARRELPFSIDPVVEQLTLRVDLRLRSGRPVERGGQRMLAAMTQRRRLDNFLAGKAADAGADFRDGVKVTSVESDGRAVAVTAGGERLRGAALVGADGVNGVTARALTLGGNRAVGVALEGNVANERCDAERYRGRFLLEFGTVPGGYAWVFPKGEHLNVGVGGWEHEGPRLRAHLAAFCARQGIAPNDLEALRGFRLPLRAPDSRLARGRALVAGDAAGLIDPLTGDGMFEAFLSGRFAAESIRRMLAGEEESVEPYGTRLTRHLAAHLWAAWTLKAALDRFPRTAFTVATHWPVWPVVEKLVTGELADVSAVHGIARPVLKSLAYLARAAGDPGRAYRVA